MQGKYKTLHMIVGLILNIVGFFVMIVPSAWASFQASPVVLNEGMGWIERAWAAANNPTWWPVNIHRIVANVVLGGFVCGAYAGFAISAPKQKKNGSITTGWDMSETSSASSDFSVAFCRLLADAGGVRVQPADGDHPHGGILSWLFILQALLIGVLFLGANYYLWQGLVTRIEGGEIQAVYRHHAGHDPRLYGGLDDPA